MKKALFLALALLLVAGTASALITNSAHDLSSGNTTYYTTAPSSTDQICVFCHTPHNATAAGGTAVYLWNRANGALSAFTLYDSATLDNSTGQPTGGSRICLSCHDGTVAIQTVFNNPIDASTGTRSAITIPAATTRANATASGPANQGGIQASGMLAARDTTNNLANFGKDISLSHPISMLYGQAGTGGTVDSGLKANPATVVLYGTGVANYTVECGSCHAVHNNTAYLPMLRDTMDGSALCLRCHNK